MSYIKFEMPTKDKNNTKRRKGKDKKKNTFKKYGKNTSRGLRIKQAAGVGLSGVPQPDEHGWDCWFIHIK